MKVCEIFHSLQGEGVTIGLPTSFIRLAGCNLDCKWCDTAYAKEEGEEMALDDILAGIEKHDCSLVCVTGGEPLHQKDTPRLVDALIERGYLVILETNGSKSVEVLQCSDGLMVSLDIKCPSSGEADKMDMSNIELLSPNDQLKFVLADESDYEYARKIIGEHKPACSVIMTPVGGTELRELAEWVLRDKLKVRVLPQLHKIIWGNERGR